MGQAGVENEGQADHRAAEQGPAGQAVAGREEIFHHRELGVGVGTEQVLVEFQVLLAGGEIARRQSGVLLGQKGQHLEVVQVVGEDLVVTRGEGQARLGHAALPAADSAIFPVLNVDQPSLGDGDQAGRSGDGYVMDRSVTRGDGNPA